MSSSNGDVYIFTGGFGSGKTETALNFAIQWKDRGPVTLVDLDIVNPYFRSRRMSEEFAQRGVRVVSTVEGMETGDAPAFSPAIGGVLRQGEGTVVLDVGGDEIGATALGSYAPMIWNRPYGMFMVVNPYRPFTRNMEEILRMKELVEARSRLIVTAMVANPHLGEETTPEDILEGWERVRTAADASGLPVRFLVMEERLRDNWPPDRPLPEGLPVFILHRYLRWPI